MALLYCFIGQDSYGMEKNSTGALINIDQDDGIVKMDADSTLKIISLDRLAKYIQNDQPHFNQSHVTIIYVRSSVIIDLLRSTVVHFVDLL